MHRKPDATGPGSPRGAGDAPDPHRLAALLREDDVDAAIEAGLMAFVDDGRHALDIETRRLLAEAHRCLDESMGRKRSPGFFVAGRQDGLILPHLSGNTGEVVGRPPRSRRSSLGTASSSERA